MKQLSEWLRQISSGAYDKAFQKLYGEDSFLIQRERYGAALKKFGELYGEEREVTLFSAPGRTEIGGNHTDHNQNHRKHAVDAYI